MELDDFQHLSNICVLDNKAWSYIHYYKNIYGFSYGFSLVRLVGKWLLKCHEKSGLYSTHFFCCIIDVHSQLSSSQLQLNKAHSFHPINLLIVIVAN